MTAKLENIIGLKSGRLTVVRELPKEETSNMKPGYRNKRMVECICECSNTVICPLEVLRRKVKTKESCGCVYKESLKNRPKKHTPSRIRTYSAWLHMRSKCDNPHNKLYKHYGAKGIKVCDKWNDSYLEFVRDMGERPEGYSIGRINLNRGYEPSNCKWIKRRKQILKDKPER